MLHQQYESMFDREYMRAVQDAFYYQRDIVGDPTGALTHPYTAKLAPLFEIVKISNSKYQKKFLANLCSKVDFEPKQLNASGNPPEHLLLARFVSQNLAFFEYGQMAELLPTIACVERIVAATGTVIAHYIETEIFPTRMQPTNGEPNAAAIPPPAEASLSQEAQPREVNPNALRQLATAAGALSMLWEARSFLRRLYGINLHTKQKEGKANPKELNKAPAKVHGITGDKFWEVTSKIMNCLDGSEAMLARCREFATFLSIDDELKVAAGDEEERDSHETAGDGDDMTVGLATANRPAKRKSSVSASGTPKKKKAKGKSIQGKKKMSTDGDDDEKWC
jgi:cohesin loading factor subunit SCC2